MLPLCKTDGEKARFFNCAGLSVSPQPFKMVSWLCEHGRFLWGSFYAPYIHIYLFIHSHSPGAKFRRIVVCFASLLIDVFNSPFLLLLLLLLQINDFISPDKLLLSVNNINRASACPRNWTYRSTILGTQRVLKAGGR